MKRGEWAERWRELASVDLMTGTAGVDQMVRRWRELAARLDDGTQPREDPILDFVLERLDASMTVLDIGAGIGRWTVPLAERAREVTAVEPVDGMREVLEQRLSQRAITNVRIVPQPWLEASVEPHDLAVAAFSMYTSPDLAAFARKMDESARRACFLAVRVPAPDGVIGELSERICGTWHDSPNFQVAYNVLLEAGFTPNVYIEPSPVRYWIDPTLPDAVARAKRHLRLEDDHADPLITETLERSLTPTGEGYRWPDYMRAALIWWEPSRS